MTKRIIGYNLIGHRCDFKGCDATADSIIRYKPTGDVVTARCKTHRFPSWRAALDRNACPKCQANITDHVEEMTDGDEWRGCDYAIDRLADAAERNLEA